LKQSIKPRPNITQLAEGVLQGDRVLLSQAITVIESNLEDDRKLSTELLDKIIHATGNSIRIGITGVPGVGKSTFIEAFGKHITSLGKKLAVLTIDPSSQLTGGSILGDKTRMEDLSRNPLAYVRPSPSGNTLGGVAEKTHDVILLCEAASYDVIIVETVGVGQSEVSVKKLVDFFLLLILAGAGDELQGIKKGIIEMADTIIITKADGENVTSANAARSSYEQALHLAPQSPSAWRPTVITSSAYTGAGIAEAWNIILEHRSQAVASGFFEENRKLQNMKWFEDHFEHLLFSHINSLTSLKSEKQTLLKLIARQKISPRHAAELLMQAYHKEIRK
jgi:LAO/AO transport system kinase